MRDRVLPPLALFTLPLALGLLLVGCDSLGPGTQKTAAPGTESSSQSALFRATNTLPDRMETSASTLALKRFGAGPAQAATVSQASVPAVTLTSIAQIDPPGDTTRASHLTYSSGRVYAGYKALGPAFKGGIDILDATDPTNIQDVNSLGSDVLDVQEVAYDPDENALYVAGAADPSSVTVDLRGTPALLSKVTNFGSPTTSTVGLTGRVGKSVVNAPNGDGQHDLYIVTDEETLYRFDTNLGNEVTEVVQDAEFRSVATTDSDIFTVDRGASIYSSGVGSPGSLSETQNIGSGVGDLAIGRLHARNEPVLNGDRLFLALGSEGIAVLDASSGDVLFREDGPYYTSLTLHEDDPAVSNEPTDLVYAARPNGVLDVYRVGPNGIDTGSPNTGLVEVGTFNLSDLDGVDFGTSPQVNQVMGVGCNVYVANSNEGVVALEIGGIQGCGGGSNQAPTASDDTDQVTTGQSTTTDVLANDSDPDGSLDASTVQIASGPTNGTVNIDGQTGAITYTPAGGFTGQDSYTYTVADDEGATSNEATVTLTVNSAGSALALQCPAESDINPSTGLPNGWPPANEVGFVGEVRIGDGAGAGSGSATFEYDLGEDTSQPDATGQFDHQDGQTVSFTLTTDGQGNAEFSIGNAADNPLTHTFDFSGDTFDGLMLRARADAGDTVRLENITLDGSAIGQDLLFTPGPGDSSQDFLLLSGPNFATGFTLEGTFTLSWDQSVPTNSALAFQIKGYDGPDNPSAFLCGTGSSNQAPSASDDSDQTTEVQPTTTDVLGNDSDPDGTLDGSTVQVTSGPSNGSVSIDSQTGEITYTPAPGFMGTDSYTYTVTDDDGAVSNPATVTLTVNRCPNPDPSRDLSGSLSGTSGTIQNGSSSCSYDVGLAIYKKFDGNIPPGQNITQILADSDTDRIVQNGSVTLDGNAPTCDYQIDLFHGPVIQDFGPGEAYGNRLLDASQVDNGGFCGPQAVDDDATTDEGTAITIDVASNDTDGDDNLDPSSVTVTNGPDHGSVTNNGDGTITYTPDSGFTGTDTFEYDICDDDDRCASLLGAEGTVTITVEAPSAPSPSGNPKAISFAAFCTTEGSFQADDVTITDIIYKDGNEPVSIAWVSETSLSTVVLKAGPNMYNYAGGTSGGAASEAGNSAGNDQSPSSPCPSGEDVILKDEHVGDGNGAG